MYAQWSGVSTGDKTMRLASWSWGGRAHAGLVSADGKELTPLQVERPDHGVIELLERLVKQDPLPKEADARLPIFAAALHSPFPKPRRNLFCVGRNFRLHAQELAGSVFKAALQDDEQWPMVFSKVPETVIGSFDTVKLPGAHVSSQIDYESEFAVIIGKPGKEISRSRAMDHVMGYTVVNDVTFGRCDALRSTALAQ
jgi:2-keto-4-pentenoate hydratase/2-oxohepta-3-ene-1,7-dioic acid hydratase in catechol pathway